MKVFISWSKDSRGVGAAMSKAVNEIFSPIVETFISQEIPAGTRGLDVIDASLNDTDFGIICLTRTNQTEQWINYEAGALSRQVDGKRQRMGVFLTDFESTDEVNSPLDIFQCKFATIEGMSDLMKSLNEISPTPIDDGTLKKRIAMEWEDVERAAQAVKEGGPSALVIQEKTSDEKLDEVLGLVKSLEASMGDAVFQRKERAVSDDASLNPAFSAAVLRRLKSEMLKSQRGDESLASFLSETPAINPDLLNATVSDIMEDLALLGDWGDMGATFDGRTVTIRSQEEIPDEIKTMLTSRIRRSHPKQVVSFKIKPRHPLE